MYKLLFFHKIRYFYVLLMEFQPFPLTGVAKNSFCNSWVIWRTTSEIRKQKCNQLYVYLLVWSLESKERGDIGLFITLFRKVFYNNIFSFVGLTTLETFIKFLLVGLFSWVSYVSTTNYWRSNFVYHHWGCTSIYLSLSYPFRSTS